MDSTQYKESGILELYVFGILNEKETKEISELSRTNSEINSEIIAIEKAIINLSSSFAPYISADIFEKIKLKLALKHNVILNQKPVIQLQSNNNLSKYAGWAASLVLLIAGGYFYNQLNENKNKIVSLEKSKITLQKSVLDLELKNSSNYSALKVIRDSKKRIVVLAGQTISPTSTAKVYCDLKTQEVFVDASSLPEPPEGMEYQLWSLKMNPLKPTSLGLLANYKNNNSKMFAVSTTGDAGAEGFGITLEPKGGSKSPTMEQLYALGII